MNVSLRSPQERRTLRLGRKPVSPLSARGAQRAPVLSRSRPNPRVCPAASPAASTVPAEAPAATAGLIPAHRSSTSLARSSPRRRPRCRLKVPRTPPQRPGESTCLERRALPASRHTRPCGFRSTVGRNGGGRIRTPLQIDHVSPAVHAPVHAPGGHVGRRVRPLARAGCARDSFQSEPSRGAGRKVSLGLPCPRPG
jgi:hypothetical protein